MDKNNDIYITSGLIENCDDYVALLLVISHEIGHVELNHIKIEFLILTKHQKSMTYQIFQLLLAH